MLASRSTFDAGRGRRADKTLPGRRHLPVPRNLRSWKVSCHALRPMARPRASRARRHDAQAATGMLEATGLTLRPRYSTRAAASFGSLHFPRSRFET
jgi:hypothetical protein